MVLKVYRENNTAIPAVKSVTYKAAVNAGEDLRPGSVSSAYIVVEVFGSQSTAPAVGEALTCYRLDDGGGETLLGTFFAEPAVQSRTTYSITAYDAIHKLDVDYSGRLAEIQDSFPMSLGDLVSDVFSVAGVDVVVEDMPLYDIDINAFYANNLTCRDIVAYAAELNGQFVIADVSGGASFSWYYETTAYRINPSSGTDDDVALIAYKQGGLEYAKYTIQPPPAVAVKPSGVEGAAYIYPATVEQAYAEDPLGDGNVVLYNLVASDDGNGNITLTGGITATASGGDVEIDATGGGSVDGALIVSGNILLTGASEETYLAVAERIYTAMQEVPAYRPSKANLFPLESPLERGSVVPVTDSQGVSFYMPIMSVSISDSVMVVEATGNETRIEKNPVEKELANLAADIVPINKLKVDWAEINEAIINTVEANELKSGDFIPANDNIYAESGMAIDLAEKNIKAVDFAVDADGKLYASAADLAGIQFGSLYIYTNLTWNPVATQDGYTKFGTMPYRNLVSIGVNGLSGDTVDAKFDYYNGSMLVGSWIRQNIPVDSFRIPLYTGEADGVDIWLKNGQSATIGTRSISAQTPTMTVPSGAQVVFNSKASFPNGITVDGLTLDSDTLITAKRFQVESNSSKSIVLSDSTRGVIVFSGIGTGARGLYFFSCNSSGSVVVTDGIAASALTLTASTNEITVASTSGSIAYGMVINF